eukprot:TRINITY_DN4427_c0_g1_i1.p1 TRINITY_DN4427_c0_g1~~TRINITY_DN4427_c0_g1_i1.p1  ORF type:complete len:481 (-),score=120.60 TRINITY_DN4427_c0_g1_i1:1153-2595(-)
MRGGVLFLLVIAFAFAQYNLNGAWNFVNSNGTLRGSGNVPGEIQIDLFNAGLIPDPYFGYGDTDLRWIAYDDWTYSRQFSMNKSDLLKKKIVLVCDGLDTVSKITLNNVVVGQSDNMFRRYIFDITNTVSGSNMIQVGFTSAINYAKQTADNYTQAPPQGIPPNCPADVQRGECHVNFIRKEQCSFSWDWGPAFAPQGIWRDIRVEAYDTVVLREVTVVTTPISFDEKTWTLNLQMFVDAADLVDGNINILLSGESIGQQTMSFFAGENVVNISLPVKGVNPWWPNGYGVANLYTLTVEITSGAETSSKKMRIGFRTVELNQDVVSNGNLFYFKVNGVPIFLKGANWIPADSFESRVTEKVLRNLLRSAKEAHYVVVRNWGGGIYQHDDFYDVCDELGLLVWEEFKFACAMYPVDNNFLSSVSEEVKYQVRRLQHHPSILVWSGNNENEAALAENWYGTSKNKEYYAFVFWKYPTFNFGI